MTGQIHQHYKCTCQNHQFLQVILAAGIFLLCFSGCSIPAGSQTIIAKTDKGYIRGAIENNIHVFKGIPYAKSPEGELRFKSPQPADRWADTLSCENFGNIAAQYDGGKKAVAGNENCLSLNIYAPFVPANTGTSSNMGRTMKPGAAGLKRKLPVVVWVHGGAMTSGSGMGMNGHAFADQDSIITVTINYRLGVFGFLYMGDQRGDYRTSGNNGLLDCIRALRWIKDNISSFGGDPSAVTVMGESAGAKLVSTLLVSPQANGLFRQLILESGAVQCIRDSATAKNIRQRLLDTLHLKNPADLFKLSTSALIEAQNKVCSGAQGTNYFGPVQDGEVISEDPYTYISKHPDQKIKLLMGTNSAESKMFMNADKRLFHADDQALKDWFGTNYRHIKSAGLKAMAKPGQLSPVMNLFTQYMYQMHSYRLADALAKSKIPVWMYRFDYSRDNSGANHAQELGYVWYSGNNTGFNAEEIKLAVQVHRSWVQFIKGKNPGKINGQSWPLFTPQLKTVMVFDHVSGPQVQEDIYNDPLYPSAGFVLN